MALVLADRVLETTAVAGTGDVNLSGAVLGYQPFSVIGGGNTTYYTIVAIDDQGAPTGDWEVGIGTYVVSGNKLQRDTVLSSSNGGAKVYFASGTKQVFLDLPSEEVLLTAGNVSGPASAVNSNFALFDGTTGKLLKDAGINASTFATAAQGAKADTAVQPGSLGTAAYLNAGVANGVATLDAGGKVPTSQIPQMGDLNYQGTWNATTNTPTLVSSSGTKGYYYVVSVAGNTNLNGITDWAVGDWAVYNGSVWQKIDNTDTVTSVNGYTGTVVLSYTDVGAQPAGTYVNSVSATSPVTSTGGTTPTIAMPAATTSVSGYLTSTDWNTFNNKSNTTGTVTSITAGTGLTGGTITSTGTIAIDSTVATLTDVQTLTNKTLTSPKANEILDTNGNEILGLSPTTSATDYLVVKNGIGVGVPLHIYADGSSTNTGLHIQPKGTGLVTISDGTDFNKGIRFRSSGSAASAITLLDAVATAGRVVTLPDATTTLVGRDTTDTLTNKSISGSTNTLTNIGNASLTNSAITINGTSTSLGGSISVGTVTSVTGTAPVVSSGGTTPAISMAAANTTTNGYLTSTDWNTFNSKQPAGTYVTAVTVVSANGFTGSSSGGATPALTLGTSITGLLKGNGTAISAATSGTDYAPATSGTSILYGNGSGGFSNVTVGSGLTFSAGTLSSTATGTVTSVSGIGTVNGLTLTGTVTSSGSLTLGGTLSLVSPPAIGGTTPNAGSFTTLKYNNGYGSVADVYGCRAWVNFKGDGTVAVIGSGNVTSITDGGVGTYTVNFTNALVDTKYSIVGSASNNGVSVNLIMTASVSAGKSTSAAPIYAYSTATVAVDPFEVNIAIFR